MVFYIRTKKHLTLNYELRGKIDPLSLCSETLKDIDLTGFFRQLIKVANKKRPGLFYQQGNI